MGLPKSLRVALTWRRRRFDVRVYNSSAEFIPA